jgi:LPXTG-site transpeptidase (sortase) family protein
VAGELVLTAGVLVLLYVAYVLWGTGIHADLAQDDLREQTLDAWANQDEDGSVPDDTAQADSPDGEASSAGGKIDIGDGYAFLRIPRFGENWEWVVVEGTDLADLARGPGHYAESADPGELGNLAIAGHRSGYGQPFGNMHDVQLGDTIEVETADGTWVYTVDQPPVVIQPTETWVVDPVPGADAGTEPNERRLTLTTCHPRYGSSERMYVSAVLTSGPEV